MTNYNLGDFLIRLKNCVMASRSELEVPATKIVTQAAKALKVAGFIAEIIEDKETLKIKMAMKNKKPTLMDIRLVSKPGLRIYKTIAEIEKIKKPFILLISTPKGFLTSKEAIKERVGGEVIAEIL
jgi:small subunit ribosomal protein S8